MESHEENTEALNTVEEKIGERIVTQQIKLVKCFDKFGSAVTAAAAKIAASHETMISTMVHMADGLTKMGKGMQLAIETSETLRKSQMSYVDTLGKVDKVVLTLVQNMEYLGGCTRKIE